MIDMLRTKECVEAVCSKRQKISKLFMLKSNNIKNETISFISPLDLSLMLQLYDEVFFENWFRESFKGQIKFSISRKMTKSAGKTICPKNIDKIKPEELVVEVRIGIDFFIHYGLVEGDKIVCGLITSNSLEALQLVFEHELCHLIEFIHFKKSNCKGKRFKAMAGNLFGHTESYHKLPTYKQIASQNLGIKIGDTITFTFKGKKLTGILYNINKRATVMVRTNNGRLIDQHGNRYSKYYVPLKLLE